jgi:hypothetical protein
VEYLYRKWEMNYEKFCGGNGMKVLKHYIFMGKRTQIFMFVAGGKERRGSYFGIL